MDAPKALQHPWLSNKNVKLKFKKDMGVLKELRKNDQPSQLHYELLLIMVDFLDNKDIHQIRETF